ncbi:hypothetical protein LCGC14_3159050 [marine sediment metagenome]|uniref:Uncharacterized protein n=1 Tax=marine sediment metagenome TaxID=412755 RepID=A0A0F8WFV5_9ZZZZ
MPMHNYHPNYRALWLSHVRQLRLMVKEGRQVHFALQCLKDAQWEAILWRRRMGRAN